MSPKVAAMSSSPSAAPSPSSQRGANQISIFATRSMFCLTGGVRLCYAAGCGAVRLLGGAGVSSSNGETLEICGGAEHRDGVGLNITGHHAANFINHVVQCFELVKLTQEAIKYGSPVVREAVLKSLCSDYYVIDKKLVCEWVSPFSEMVVSADRSIWLPRLDSNQ